MRALCFGLWPLLLAACASAPPAAAPAPTAAPREPLARAPVPEPGPEPLPAVVIEHEQTGGFLQLHLGMLNPTFMSEQELEKRLPASARAEYQAVRRARQAAKKARHARQAAGSARDACGACANQARLDAKLDAANRAASATESKLEVAHSKATLQLEQRFAANATPEVGLALARLYTWGTALDRSAIYGKSSPADAPPNDAAIAVLERSVELSSLDDIGRKLRLELVHQLMGTERASDAEPLLNALLPASPPEQRPELLVRIALLHGRAGDDVRAADSFERAQDELTATSSVARELLLSGELVARYRAGQYERVLELAAKTWDQLAQPPPPPREPRAPRAASVFSGVMFGPLWRSGLTEDEVLRLATDAVERLGREPARIPGSQQFRAGVVTRLSVRALYRNDERAARHYAETAASSGAQSAREAFRVLQILARRDGDGAQAAELRNEGRQIDYGRGSHGRDLEHALLDQEERNGPAKSEKPVRVSERAIRSLLRLCIEPVHERFVAGNQQIIATVHMAARVFESGEVQVEARADGNEPLTQIVSCLEQLGPRVLAAAPASITAKIAIDRSVLIAGEGLFGMLLGEPLGSSFGEGRREHQIGLGNFGAIGTGDRGGTGAIKRRPKPKPAKKP
jgi:hypothetical protein